MSLSSDSKKWLEELAVRNRMSVRDLRDRFLEEALRREANLFVDFRSSALGRQAFIAGSSLAVWEIMLLARNYNEDFTAVAEHLRWSQAKAEGAYVYAEIYSEEIGRALDTHDETDFERLSNIYPGIQGVALETNRPGKGGSLHLLLDDQICPVVAEELRLRVPRLTVETLAEIADGLFVKMVDEDLLVYAADAKIVFVTYDRASMSATLHNWRETGPPHHGVIVIDDKTIPPSDVTGLVDSLQKLVELSLDWAWGNRVMYLHR